MAEKLQWGDRQPPPKYMKNSSRYGTTSTKQPPGDTEEPEPPHGVAYKPS